MRSFLIRCYPARWRARYGEEFEAMLEERPLGPFDVADILLGALDAHLRRAGRGATNHTGRGIPMSLRIGGIAAIIGVSLLTFGLFVISGLFVTVESRFLNPPMSTAGPRRPVAEPAAFAPNLTMTGRV